MLAAVAEAPGELDYHVFDEPALNTLDAALAAQRERETRYRVLERRPVRTVRLDALLDEHLPQGQTIDFLSVDAEGLDLQVLRSNDWTRYRPELALVEALDFRLAEAASHPIDAFMRNAGYELVAKTLNTLCYRRNAQR